MIFFRPVIQKPLILTMIEERSFLSKILIIIWDIALIFWADRILWALIEPANISDLLAFGFCAFFLTRIIHFVVAHLVRILVGEPL